MSKEIITVSELPINNIENGCKYIINQSNPNSYTHAIFKYPCKFIPEIPRWGIKKYISDNGKVLDPFAGSGTSLLEANILGYDAYGTEIDPLAKKIIKAKTTRLSKEDINKIKKSYNELQKMDINSYENYIPNINNLTHWFNDDAIKKLSTIKKFYIENTEGKVSDFFEITFSSIIKRCSNSDDSSPKPYVSSKIKKTPPDVFEEFDKTFNKYIKFYEEFMNVDNSAKSIILNGDALNIKSNQLYDLAITSPPYINAFDYARILRLENLWIGSMTEKQILESKENYVGTEKINISGEKNDLNILRKSEELYNVYNKIILKDKKRALIVKRFFEDMEKNLLEVRRLLKVNSKYILVIGDSTIRKETVKSSKILSEIASKNGYYTEKYYSYKIQNPYLNIPRKNKGGKIKWDNILVLSKGD